MPPTAASSSTDGERLPDGPGSRLGIRGPKILPPSDSEMRACFGPRLWDRMDLDPVLYSTVCRAMTAAVSGGVHVLPFVQPEPGTEPDAKARRAAEMADFGQSLFDGLDRPITDVLREMGIAAWKHGNKLAEVVERRDRVGGRVVLKEIAPKPWWCWRLAVDGLGKPVGVVPAGSPSPLEVTPGGVWPLDDFAILSWDCRDGDIRGNSLYEHVYRPWNYKTQLYPEHFAYQGRFASPSVSVEIDAAAPVAVEEVDYATGLPTGNRIAVEVACYRAVLAWRNGYVLVLPPGCKAVVHEAVGNGEAFIRGKDGYNDEMAQGVLHTARAVMKSEKNSQADAGAAKDTENDLIEWLGGWLARPLRPVLAKYVALNFGAADARDLMPILHVGEMATPDIVSEMGVAVGAGYTLHQSQFEGLDQRYGMPKRAEGWDDAPEPVAIDPNAPPAADPNAANNDKPKPPKEAK